jgi:hypothetical protein
MNWLPIPKWIRWLTALAILVLGGTLWVWSRLAWTPIQRYYIGAYLECSWPGSNPASSVEVRWIYKTAANGTPELAGEDDAIPATDADSRIGMELSPAARQAGGTNLMEGPEERLTIAMLKPMLEEQFFDGQNFWIILLMPLLCGLLLYCFLLIVWARYEDWIDSVPWPAGWIEWGESVRGLFHACGHKMGRIPFRLPEREKYSARKTAPKMTTAAPETAGIEPPRESPQVAFAPFGSTDGMRKQGFVWSEKDEIE